MLLRALLVVMLVGPGRRDRDLRLGEHDPEGRHGVKRLEHFAAARRQHRPAHDGERDVRAELRAVRAEFRLRQAEFVERIDAAQNSGRIGAAARESRSDRDALRQCDAHAAFDALAIQEKARRAPGEIALVGLEARHVERELDAARDFR